MRNENPHLRVNLDIAGFVTGIAVAAFTLVAKGNDVNIAQDITNGEAFLVTAIAWTCSALAAFSAIREIQDTKRGINSLLGHRDSRYEPPRHKPRR